jgi:hypothetical protein
MANLTAAQLADLCQAAVHAGVQWAEMAWEQLEDDLQGHARMPADMASQYGAEAPRVFRENFDVVTAFVSDDNNENVKYNEVPVHVRDAMLYLFMKSGDEQWRENYAAHKARTGVSVGGKRRQSTVGPKHRAAAGRTSLSDRLRRVRQLKRGL